MQKDPIVEEIRDLRKAHAAKFNYDLKAICVDMKKKEKKMWAPCCFVTSETSPKSDRELII
jgi:hypothetical protein